METPRYPRVTLPVLISDSIVRFAMFMGIAKPMPMKPPSPPGPELPLRIAVLMPTIWP